jgi:hypothetical protein
MKGCAAMSKTVELSTDTVTVKYGTSNSYKKTVEKLLRIMIEKKLKLPAAQN